MKHNFLLFNQPRLSNNPLAYLSEKPKNCKSVHLTHKILSCQIARSKLDNCQISLTNSRKFVPTTTVPLKSGTQEVMHLNQIIGMVGPEWNNCRVSIITIGSVSPTVGPRNVIAPASNLMSCVWSDRDKVYVQEQNCEGMAKRLWAGGEEDSQQHDQVS